MTHHEALWKVAKSLPEDYEPYGQVQDRRADCSCGCAYFYTLATRNKEALGADWGVCGNPNSHRAGLLTFEHQGCHQFSRRRIP